MKSLILTAGVALATFTVAGNARADHPGYRGYSGAPPVKAYRYGPAYHPSYRYGYVPPPPVRPIYPPVYYGPSYRYWSPGPNCVQPGISFGFSFYR